MASDSQTSERHERKEQLRRDMFTHLADLQERVEELLAARDPFGVYNAVHSLRSLIGQVDGASRRYREIS